MGQSLTQFNHLSVTSLENRCVPAAVWPFPDGPAQNRLLETYGQYSDLTQGAVDTDIRIHEGIDIRASNGTDVRAVMDGFIVDFSPPGTPAYNSYVIIRDKQGNMGWNYKHIIPAEGLVREAQVTADVTVLGKVASAPQGIPDHLHLDRGQGRDIGRTEKHLPNWFAPNLNPLREFDNGLDQISPTVESINFRMAGGGRRKVQYQVAAREAGWRRASPR
jgi:hypothetical protein